MGKVSLDIWVQYFYNGTFCYERTFASLNRLQMDMPTIVPDPLSDCDHVGWGNDEGPNPWALDPVTYLAAYLAYWLATFAIPHGDTHFLRPEEIYPACSLACGVQLAVAPAALANIYYSFGALSCASIPQQCRITMVTHYISAWSGLLLPELVSVSPNSSLSSPSILRFSGCPCGNAITQLRDARHALHFFSSNKA